MQLAINQMCSREQPDVIQIESSVLSAFALPRGPRVVLDEHNIESELLRRMGDRERSRLRRAFNLWEYRRYRRFEQRCWQRVNGCLITSAREQPLVSAFAPAARTTVVPNGVDLDYFSPSSDPVVSHSAVFNGVLDYRPNLDAAYHLVEDVWPLVVQRCPGARLTLVGRGYAEDIRRLSRPGIAVTGEVPDIRPYLKRAAVVTVPVRIGGGTRLKVVEGLAMAKAMVSTSLGCEGVAVRDREHLLIGDGAPDFAGRILELFADPLQGVRLGQAGRSLIEAEYSWDSAGERMDAIYSSVAHAEPAAGPLLAANR
jgi:glycosyltransferase involved in cell wall biosynthesis